MEEIPPRIYEIQAGHILGLNCLQDLVDWAVNAIVVGFDSPSLRVLAGLQAPFDNQEVDRLFSRVFSELDIISLTKGNCIPFYIAPIVRQTIEGKIQQRDALKKLKDLCLATNYEKPLMDFYLLYHALSDLEISVNQWYWKGANCENINQIISDYFKNWLKNQSADILV